MLIPPPDATLHQHTNLFVGAYFLCMTFLTGFWLWLGWHLALMVQSNGVLVGWVMFGLFAPAIMLALGPLFSYLTAIPHGRVGSIPLFFGGALAAGSVMLCPFFALIRFQWVGYWLAALGQCALLGLIMYYAPHEVQKGPRVVLQ